MACVPCDLLHNEGHLDHEHCPLSVVDRDRGDLLASCLIQPLDPPERASGNPIRGGIHSDVTRSTREGVEVAVKLPRFHIMDGPEQYQRSCEQVLIMKAASHPFVLPVIGVYVIDEDQHRRLAIVTLWCETDSLEKRLFNLKLVDAIDGCVVLRLLTEVATALDHIHSRNIVHNGIHPKNVYIAARTGCAQLAGFRSAVIADSDSPHSPYASVVGHWGYCSPQKVRYNLQPGPEGGNEQAYMPDPSDDIFAFGTLMYVVYATEKHPFGSKPYSTKGITVQRLLNGVRPARPEPARCRVPLPDAVWALIERCWADDPAARPAADEVVYELSNVHANANRI